MPMRRIAMATGHCQARWTRARIRVADAQSHAHPRIASSVGHPPGALRLLSLSLLALALCVVPSVGHSSVPDRSRGLRGLSTFAPSAYVQHVSAHDRLAYDGNALLLPDAHVVT